MVSNSADSSFTSRLPGVSDLGKGENLFRVRVIVRPTVSDPAFDRPEAHVPLLQRPSNQDLGRLFADFLGNLDERGIVRLFHSHQRRVSLNDDTCGEAIRSTYTG